jgi:hypothetical protein
MDNQVVDASVDDMENEKFVGSFEVTSGVLVIGDPMLDGNSVVRDVANGEWYAEVTKTPCGRFNSRLTVYFGEKVEEFQEEVDLVEDICADTGTMGIFCDSAYDDSNWLGDHEMLEHMLGNEDSAGSAPGGVACMSGFGDGIYDATVVRDLQGRAVSVCIYFIEEEQEGLLTVDDNGACEIFDIRDLCIKV